MEAMPVKKESTLDLLTVMSDKVTVKFRLSVDEYVTKVGHWCNICKSVSWFCMPLDVRLTRMVQA